MSHGSTPSRTDRAAELVRRVRAISGLSQRQLAESAGTSGPTVAAYELGTREARLSTLERLARAAGLSLEIRLVAGDRGATARARRERRSLALAAATAVAVERDWARARKVAERNLKRAEAIVGANQARRWVGEWRDLLDQGAAAVQAALLDPSPHGHDLRQMGPFSGLLTEQERDAALAVASVLEDVKAPVPSGAPPWSAAPPGRRGPRRTRGSWQAG